MRAKKNGYIFLMGIGIYSISLLSCNGNEKMSLNQFNDSELISQFNIFYSDTSELSTCGIVKSSSLLFSIKHEKNINLKKYKVIIRFNGYIVYDGIYEEKIKLSAKTCLVNSQDIVITIYDDKEYFRWRKKTAYKIANYSQADIKLLSKSNFLRSTGDQYEIKFK